MLQDEPQAESEQRVASEQALQAATTALASALELRDAKPAGQVQELARAALELLDVVFDREDEHGAASSHSRGNALSVRGQALALLDGRAAEAEEALTRAVKLCPSQSLAWNTLGELAWKRGDLSKARAAFTSANAKSASVQALRNLSGVARSMAQGAATLAEQQALTSDSVAYAKSAVALNVEDGASWYQLAMALMAHAFAHRRTRAADLAPASKAFAHAAKNGAALDADLCFNRGTLLRFLDDVQGALDCFREAGALDPELPWQSRVDALFAEVARVHDLVSNRGRLKPKRLVEACAALSALQPPAGFSAVTVKALSDAANDGCAALFTVVAMASPPGAVPLVIAAVDAGGDCCAVSTFGVHEAAMREGAILAVLAPVPTHVVATLPDGRQPAYTVLRVEGIESLRFWHRGAWTAPQAERQTPSVRFQV